MKEERGISGSGEIYQKEKNRWVFWEENDYKEGMKGEGASAGISEQSMGDYEPSRKRVVVPARQAT
jgi:hypothetical protein